MNITSAKMNKVADESNIGVIRAKQWRPYAKEFAHVFLAGNLQRPVPHPYFQRDDVEIICCDYAPGAHGLPHWHAQVDEFELVISGRVGYVETTTAALHWFDAGDLINIEHGICVTRVVEIPTQTIAIKLPSSSEKVHCAQCDRSCRQRRTPFVAS
jgi:hypothetical protein